VTELEAPILRRVMLALSRAGAVVFRNNVGVGWAGKATRITVAKTVRLWPGDVVVRNARPLHAGLCTGSSDVIGWMSVTVTPDMVGRKVAVFLAPEVKNADGRATEDQIRFLRAVTEAGGIAGVARSEEEAVSLIGRPGP
jgi:hypothetical protein